MVLFELKPGENSYVNTHNIYVYIRYILDWDNILKLLYWYIFGDFQVGDRTAFLESTGDAAKGVADYMGRI